MNFFLSSPIKLASVMEFIWFIILNINIIHIVRDNCDITIYNGNIIYRVFICDELTLLDFSIIYPMIQIIYYNYSYCMFL